MSTRDIVVRIEIPFRVEERAFDPRTIIPGWNSVRMHTYMEAVEAEIRANAAQYDDCCVTAVRFGGGAASNAGADVAAVMRALRQSLHVADDASVTMRASIANISGATMPFFKRAGVERFDFEMLSLNPADFTRLNRVDKLDDLPIICDHFLHSYANGSLGFVLLYGHDAPIGEDAVLNVRRSMVACARTHASHVILERYQAGDAAPESVAVEQLAQVREVLFDHGFAEYAPLRFAREGAEDRFVCAKAAGVEQIGFGLGALTRIDGVVSTNTSDLARYCVASHDFAQITTSVEPLAAG